MENTFREMEAVIFDMDGLMFDTEAISVKAWDYAGEQMGLGKTGYMAIRLAGCSKIMKDKILAEEFQGKYRWDDFGPYLAEYRRQYFQTHEVPVKKGLYRLLDYLEKEHYKMAVASATQRSGVEENLEKTGVRRYFDVVIGGDMVAASKPDPDIFLKACEMLEEEPERCYVLEDSRYGLYAAHSAGCHACMVPDLWQPDSAVREFVEGIFPDLDGFREYLEKGRQYNGNTQEA